MSGNSFRIAEILVRNLSSEFKVERLKEFTFCDKIFKLANSKRVT